MSEAGVVFIAHRIDVSNELLCDHTPALDNQRKAALEAIHGPTHGPGRNEYYRIQMAMYRRRDIRQQVAELVPGLHPGKFIRTVRPATGDTPT